MLPNRGIASATREAPAPAVVGRPGRWSRLFGMSGVCHGRADRTSGLCPHPRPFQIQRHRPGHGPCRSLTNFSPERQALPRVWSNPVPQHGSPCPAPRRPVGGPDPRVSWLFRRRPAGFQALARGLRCWMRGFTGDRQRRRYPRIEARAARRSDARAEQQGFDDEPSGQWRPNWQAFPPGRPAGSGAISFFRTGSPRAIAADRTEDEADAMSMHHPFPAPTPGLPSSREHRA